MRRTPHLAPEDGRAIVTTGTRAAHARQVLPGRDHWPPQPPESRALSPAPTRPHDPATALSIFAGAIDPPTLISEISALRHDLNGRVIVQTSATPCDIDLRYWPTGAHQHVRLEEVGHGLDTVWRRGGER